MKTFAAQLIAVSLGFGGIGLAIVFGEHPSLLWYAAGVFMGVACGLSLAAIKFMRTTPPTART